MKAVQIKNLSKTYAQGLKAVNSINLDIEAGDFFALLGPNGAGKSTTIGILTTLVRKTSGQINVLGHDLDTETNEVKKCLGLVPQEFNFNIFESCHNICTQQAGYYGIRLSQAKKQSEKYLRLTGLWEKRHMSANQLSGGMKRRLMIARAMVHEPKILILDEPTAGVDIEIRRYIWSFLKKLNQNGTTIILTTHYLEEVEQLCKNVAMIKQGEIVYQSSIKKLLQKQNRQSFILNLENEGQPIPESKDFEIHSIDADTLEVVTAKNQTLNNVFDFLSSHGIKVQSIRSKNNRIEDVFLEMIHGE